MFWGCEARGTAMRDGNWKFLTLQKGGQALCDLSNDIGETNNLATTLPEKATQMSLAVTQWLAEVHTGFPLKAWGQ